MNNNQREMPLFAALKDPVFADRRLIESCKDGLDAIRLCIQLSNFSRETVAKRLSIDTGHMSRMMQGRASFPDRKRIDLMLLCGNYAPTQFDAFALGLKLAPRDKEERIRELESELLKLKGAA